MTKGKQHAVATVTLLLTQHGDVRLIDAALCNLVDQINH